MVIRFGSCAATRRGDAGVARPRRPPRSAASVHRWTRRWPPSCQPTPVAGDPLDLAVALILRGATWNSGGNYAAAEEPLREARVVANQIADPRLRAGVAGRALSNQGVSARGQGDDLARATAYNEEALHLYRGHDFDLAEAVALMNLGAIAAGDGEHALAAARWREGIFRMGERGDVRVTADALSGIACLATGWGDDRSALHLFGAADALRERAGTAMLWPSDIAATAQSLATLNARLGSPLVAAGLAEGRSLSAAAATALAISVAQAAEQATPSVALTRRELDVRRLLGEGRTDREIADTLYLSRCTVNWHVRSILAKLGAPSRQAAVA